MYQSNYMRRPFPMNGRPMPYGNRLVGGFAAPFLLGGLAGGLLAPAFYPRPFYPPYPPYPIYY